MDIPPIAGAIFDMDGTILDSSPAWATVERDVLLELGYTPSPTLQQDVFPLGALDTAPFLRRTYRMRESVQEINRRIDRRVAHYYADEARLKPGALGLLRALRAGGVRLALATATAEGHAVAALRRTGALPLFDAVCTCSRLGYTKGAPAFFRAVLAELGTRAGETWVFEDALYAVETARSVGLITCAVADEAAAFQWDALCRTADHRLQSFAHWREALPFARQLPDVP